MYTLKFSKYKIIIIVIISYCLFFIAIEIIVDPKQEQLDINFNGRVLEFKPGDRGVDEIVISDGKNPSKKYWLGIFSGSFVEEVKLGDSIVAIKGLDSILIYRNNRNYRFKKISKK
jgi:hypothetical protein